MPRRDLNARQGDTLDRLLAAARAELDDVGHEVLTIRTVETFTAYREEETGTIWFFTREDTDLAKDAAVGSGQSAMFHYGYA